MEKNTKIYIAGHTGMVGSALVRKLKEEEYHNLVLRTHAELDLLDQHAVTEFFQKEKPEYVFLAAAKVGGIMANNRYRAQFIYENIQIQNNVIHQAYVHGTKKLLFLGSSCIYPRNAAQPLKEEYLLTGELEYTNEPYAIAKIAGIKMCESYNIQYGTNFISAMPTNLYGPNDNYNLGTSHVLAAIIRKIHLGKCLENNDWKAIRKDFDKNPVEGVDVNSSKQEIQKKLEKHGITQHPPTSTKQQVTITLWGTGKPKREFIHSDDLADACLFLMENIDFNDIVSYSEPSTFKNTHINIGCGEDQSIKELAASIKEVLRYKGSINWDTTKPDGTFQKLMDVSRLKKLGWERRIGLEEGISSTYCKYVKA